MRNHFSTLILVLLLLFMAGGVFGQSTPAANQEVSSAFDALKGIKATDSTISPIDTDEDGIPNNIDPDIDNDGTPNNEDPDMDDDGIPNGEDHDINGNGIPNNEDPDMDSDGIPNEEDEDVNGNGIPNEEDPDIDNDGIPNIDDPDIDNDGIPNIDDPDIDNDGVSNQDDSDSDNDGEPNDTDTDDDNDGIPDEDEPLTITIPGSAGEAPSEQEFDDVDGDGVPNSVDLDSDNDGISDADEIAAGEAAGNNDADGDGIPNHLDNDEGIYQPSWFAARVLAFTKGTRPAPETYLTATYLESYKDLFDEHGGAFIIVRREMENSQDPALPSNKFVILRSDMNTVVANYRLSGNVADIETALGYTAGDLKNLDPELFVFHLDTAQFIFNIPDGNEDSANDLWIPAGKTSGGFYEAVIIDKNDPDAQIVHNNDINNLKDLFTHEQPVYKPGWSDTRVLANPKGSHPTPNTYLVGPYIDYYLSQFDTAALVVTPSWLESEQGNSNTFPTKKYTLHKAELRAILANTDLVEKRQILGGLGYSLNVENYVFHIGNKAKYKFELSDGNEEDASESWKPGGINAQGYREVVIIDKADYDRGFSTEVEILTGEFPDPVIFGKNVDMEALIMSLLGNISPADDDELDPLTNTAGIMMYPGPFWTEPHPSDHPAGCGYHYEISADNHYGLKYDPHSGELLFFDIQNKVFLGYFLDEGFGQNGNGRHYSDPSHTDALNLDVAMQKLQRMYGIDLPNSIALGDGQTLPLNPLKKNVLMGSFGWPDYPVGTTGRTVNETKYLTSVHFEGRRGGYQLLNVPERMYRTTLSVDLITARRSNDFWDIYNLPWIQGLASDPEAEFIVLTNPMNADLLFGASGAPSGFNKELTTLLNGNYNLDLQYDAAVGMYKWVKYNPGENPDQTEEDELRTILLIGRMPSPAGDDELEPLTNTAGIMMYPGPFWTEPHPSDHPAGCGYHYEISADNHYGLKYDPHSGELLFFDIQNKVFLGYFLDEGFGQNGNGRHYSDPSHTDALNLDVAMQKLQRMYGIDLPNSIALGDGQTLPLNPLKKNVLMGSFGWPDFPLGTTGRTVNETKYLTSVDFTGRRGGYQLLNVPERMYRTTLSVDLITARRSNDFWDIYNLPWIQGLASDPEAEFIVLTNPMNADLLFGASGAPSGFNKELTTLLNGNYNLDLQYDAAVGMYKWVKYNPGENPDQTEEDELRTILLIGRMPSPAGDDELDPLTNTAGIMMYPGPFWTEPHPSDHPAGCGYHYEISADNHYGLKYDPHSGELLFFDIQNKVFLGYFLDEGFGQNGNGRHYSDPSHTDALNLDVAMQKLQRMYGIDLPNSIALGDGQTLPLNPLKKNVLMGSFGWPDFPLGTTGRTVNETKYLTSVDFTGRRGGYQLLNVPERMYRTTLSVDLITARRSNDFWDIYNLPWIQGLASDPEAEFIVLTNPMNADLLFGASGAPSGFNKELTTLLNGNYNLDLQYDAAVGMYKWVKYNPGENPDQTEEDELRTILLIGRMPSPAGDDELEPLTNTAGIMMYPGPFWTEPHPSDHPAGCGYHYEISADNHYGLKYDPHSGELLFFDIQNKVFLGYFLDEGFGQNGNGRHYSDPSHTDALNLDVAMQKLQRMYGIDLPNSIALGDGQTLPLNPLKKNVLMGSFGWPDFPLGTTGRTVNETKYLTSVDFTGRRGGYQLLNVPERMYRTTLSVDLITARRSNDFWDIYNLPWIQGLASDPEAEFIVLTNPMNADLLFGASGAPSGFNKELTTLLNGNYNLDLQYDAAVGMYKWVKYNPGENPDQTEEDELRTILLIGRMPSPAGDDELEPLTNTAGIMMYPGPFWTEPHPSDHPAGCGYHYEISADNHYGLKYDPHSGELLFFDIQNKVFLGYFLDEGFGQNGNGRHYSDPSHTDALNLDVAMQKLQRMYGIDLPNSIALGDGQTLPLNPLKKNVLMGSFGWPDFPLGTTGRTVNETKYLTSVDFTGRRGGYQLLNVPERMYRTTLSVDLITARRSNDFWDIYNLPWIQGLASDPEAEFIVLTNPMNADLLFGASGAPSGFNKELTTLLNGNYNLDLQYDAAVGMYKWVKYNPGENPDQTEEDELRTILLIGRMPSPAGDDELDPLTNTAGIMMYPGPFWTEPHPSDHPAGCGYHYEISADNHYGLKYDPHSGELLFFDIQNKVFLGYFLDEGFGQNGNGRHYSDPSHTDALNLDVAMQKLQRMYGIDLPNSIALGDGQTLPLNPLKKNVLMGSFGWPDFPLGTTGRTVNETKYLTSVDFTGRRGGYQLLNVPERMYRTTLSVDLITARRSNDFWDIYNLPWIQGLASDPEAEFIVLTNPMNADLLFGASGAPSGFNKELTTLLNGNYNLDLQYDAAVGMYKWVKCGDCVGIDLTEENELQTLLNN